MKKIIFIRHGQSEGNVDFKVYDAIPDQNIILTKFGWEQACSIGHDLWKFLPHFDDSTGDLKVFCCALIYSFLPLD